MSDAGARWAAIDGDATDSPSVDQLGIDYRWPEPGEACMCADVTAQLYWPRLAPPVSLPLHPEEK